MIICLLFCCSFLFSQEDYRKYTSFFQTQEAEFQAWLDVNHLSGAFKTDGLLVEQDRVILYLTSPAGDPHCDSLQMAWKSWESQFNKTHRFRQLFHQKLLETWSVLAEVPAQHTEIIIRCPKAGLFTARIFGETDGRVLVEENDLKAMGGGIIGIPFGDLKDIYTGGRLDSLGRRLSVRKVRLEVGKFIAKHYEGKGTPILYNVRIDTSASYFNEFTWEFTHLSHEVLDAGYFEYHRIKIEVQERNNKLELTWQFTGKFGSGILFPPKENDYKLMETYYKDDLEKYEQDLFKKITEHLKKQL
jgi:hypothetical protein